MTTPHGGCKEAQLTNIVISIRYGRSYLLSCDTDGRILLIALILVLKQGEEEEGRSYTRRSAIKPRHVQTGHDSM